MNKYLNEMFCKYLQRQVSVVMLLMNQPVIKIALTTQSQHNYNLLYGKMRTRKNFAFGHFPPSDNEFTKTFDAEHTRRGKSQGRTVYNKY